MEITIDTAKDSPESIKKAISLLQSIVGDNAMANPPDIMAGAEQSSPIGNIFGDSNEAVSQQPSAQQQEQLSQMIDASSFGNIFDSNTPLSEIAKQNSEEPKSRADDEPISDRALFADLFTEEELKKMESENTERKSTEETEENDEEEISTSKKTSKKRVIEFY